MNDFNKKCIKVFEMMQVFANGQNKKQIIFDLLV